LRLLFNQSVTFQDCSIVPLDIRFSLDVSFDSTTESLEQFYIRLLSSTNDDKNSDHSSNISSSSFLQQTGSWSANQIELIKSSNLIEKHQKSAKKTTVKVFLENILFINNNNNNNNNFNSLEYGAFVNEVKRQVLSRELFFEASLVRNLKVIVDVVYKTKSINEGFMISLEFELSQKGNVVFAPLPKLKKHLLSKKRLVQWNNIDKWWFRVFGSSL
jgi:hypothetical protein